MSIVNAIYNAPVIRCSHFDDNFTSVVIKYNGQTYKGMSYVHPDDREYFSKKVGRNIALSRARTKAMKAELKRCNVEYRERKIFANLRTDLNKDFEMQTLIDRSKWRCEDLRAAIKREKHNLYKYIQGQERAVQSVKRLREKVKTD